MDILEEYKLNQSPVKKKFTKYFLIGLFIISPLISLPFILIEIYNKRKYALVLLAIFMGLVAILFPPVYDLYRHYETFNGFETVDDSLNENIFVRPDFILPYTNILLRNLDLHFGLVPFIFTSVTYLILFWIFNDIIKNERSLEKFYFRIFLIFLFSAHFFVLITGLRYVAGVVSFFLGFYLLFKKNKKLGYLFMIFGCCIHFSLIVYLFLYTIFYKLKLNPGNKRILISSLFCVLFINQPVIEFFIDILPLSNGLKILFKAYCFGIFGTLEDRSLVYIIAYTIDILLFLPLLVTTFKLPRDRYSNLARCSVIILAITFGFSFLFFYRFSFIFILIALSAYLFNINKFKIKYLTYLLIVSSIMFISDGYRYRRELLISEEYKLLAPLPVIISNYSYSGDWIKDNIDNEGVLRNAH